MKNKTLKIAAVVLVAVMCAACLVACAPATPEKLKEKLEGKNYDVDLENDKISMEIEAEMMGFTGLEASLTAEKDKELISVWFFDSAAHAKDAKKKIDDQTSKSDKDDMKERDLKYGVSGKYMYAGTKQAAKDAGF